MSKRLQMILGSLVLFFGLLLLIDNLFDISFWQFCWPIALILVGIFMLVGPRFRTAGSEINLRLFGVVKRSGNWDVANEEIWMFVGDIRLDLTEASFPGGETTIRVIGFVGDLDIIAPPEVGLSVAATGFLNSTKLYGRKQDTFMSTLHHVSDGYSEAERKLHLEMLFFVNDLNIKQA